MQLWTILCGIFLFLLPVLPGLCAPLGIHKEYFHRATKGTSDTPSQLLRVVSCDPGTELPSVEHGEGGQIDSKPPPPAVPSSHQEWCCARSQAGAGGLTAAHQERRGETLGVARAVKPGLQVGRSEKERKSKRKEESVVRKDSTDNVEEGSCPQTSPWCQPPYRIAKPARVQAPDKKTREA